MAAVRRLRTKTAFSNRDDYKQLQLVSAQPFECGITALHYATVAGF